MEFTKSEIRFNDEERFIAGLPDNMHIGDGCGAILQIMNARRYCLDGFVDLLLSDEEMTPEDRDARLTAYSSRISRLDGMQSALEQVAA